ncbi:hypothetical protein MMAD_17430 [Mycolicibacterium madagascariense]|uniref:Uncharacterized protein n=1 Tax=Mycolicibacterium madagascariense TaxID=212765 RepID=A0A7I7XEK0_9MYCO|nr:hypothetical protein MMAD_17430 [Mycolicibacterium madagascariense]
MVVDVPDRFGTGMPGDVSGVCVTVVGGSGPGPSGSTIVVAVGGPLVEGVVLGPEVDVVDVGLVSEVVVSVVVGVVVGVDRYVVRGAVCTLVRGTHVYSGSGMKPGGTTWVASGAAGGGGAGW